MKDNRNTVSKSINGIEYTMVLDKDQLSRDILKPGKRSTQSLKEDIDKLYEEYERMRLNEPSVLDKDDIYPRSYQWRLGDRYDMGKVAAIEEALRSWKKIEETEAYEKYIKAASGRIHGPDSWD